MNEYEKTIEDLRREVARLRDMQPPMCQVIEIGQGCNYALHIERIVPDGDGFTIYVRPWREHP